MLVQFVHERFLYRASISSHRDQLILKGGMLLAALGPRRATQDVDLLARGLDADRSSVANVVAEIARIAVDDGVRYDADQLTTQTIRDLDAYSGIRVVVPGHVDRARVILRLDVNVGDPVTPAPIEIDFPSLLGTPFSLRAYPLATVLAEKIVTMMQRGDTNTRERDIADIIMLTRRHQIDPAEVLNAIVATATHRGATIRPLGQVVGQLGAVRQRDWQAFCRRAELDAPVPEDYQEALDEVCAFVDPMLSTR